MTTKSRLQHTVHVITLGRIRLGAGLTSFGLANFLAILGFATALSEERFGQFAIIYAAGLLLAAFPAYGIGPYLLSALVRKAPNGELRSAKSLLTIYIASITCIFLVTALVRADLIHELLAVYIIFLGNTCYAIAEQVSRGTGGMAKLVSQRVVGSVGLAIALAFVVAQDDPDAFSAAISRGSVLLIVGAWYLRYRPLAWGPRTRLLPTFSDATGFFMGAMFMVGVQSIDKLVLSLSMPLEELGRYAALFFITFMVGNRVSDLAQVVLVDRIRRHRSVLERNHLLVLAIVTACIFVGILGVAVLAELFVLHLSYTPKELLLYAVGATLLFVSDVLWWTDSIKRGYPHRFSIVGLALLCSLIVALAYLPITTITDMGLLLFTLALTSTVLGVASLIAIRAPR